MARSRKALSSVASRKESDSELIRLDNLVNVLTGLGTARDKRVYSTFSDQRFSADELEVAYRNNDMIARIVDEVPAEMFRKGWDFTTDDEKATEIATALSSIKDELDFDAYAEEATAWARLFGGAAIIAGLDDGREAHEPLELDALKSVKWLNVLIGPELIPHEWFGEPTDANYGRVKTFRLYPRSHHKRRRGTNFGIIHTSRMILFDGARVTTRQRRINQGWGDPVPQRCWQVVLDFCSAYGGTGALLQDFNQGVFKLAGLSELIKAGREDVVRKRFEVIDMARSILRMMVVDADGESFERVTTNVSGLDALLVRMEHRLAAAADMPVSRIMGQSPGGLANADQGQARWWYDRIAAKQNKELRPRINQFVQWILRSKEGPTDGVELKNWEVKFRPLQQLTELEQSQIRLNNSNADQIDIMNNVLTPDEVAESAYGGGEYSSARKLDKSLRKIFESPLQLTIPGTTPAASEEPERPETKPTTEASPEAFTAPQGASLPPP